MSDTVLFIAAIICVSAPLLAAGAMFVPGGGRHPRLHAVGGLGTVLIAAMVLARWQYMASAGSLTWGPELAGGRLLIVDGLTAMLLPYVSTVGVAIAVAAPRRSLDAAIAMRMLVGVACTMASMLTAHPAVLVLLWIVTAIPTWIATRSAPGGRPVARVYALAMTFAAACVAAGTALMVIDPPWSPGRGVAGVAGGWLVAVAVMIRKGIVPFHSWYPALFSAAPLSAALTATMPQVASYTAIRLPVSDWLPGRSRAGRVWFGSRALVADSAMHPAWPASFCSSVWQASASLARSPSWPTT